MRITVPGRRGAGSFPGPVLPAYWFELGTLSLPLLVVSLFEVPGWPVVWFTCEESLCIRGPVRAVSELMPPVAPERAPVVSVARMPVSAVPPCIVPDSVPAAPVLFRRSPLQPAIKATVSDPKSHGVHFIRFTSVFAEAVRVHRRTLEPNLAL